MRPTTYLLHAKSWTDSWHSKWQWFYSFLANAASTSFISFYQQRILPCTQFFLMQTAQHMLIYVYLIVSIQLIYSPSRLVFPVSDCVKRPTQSFLGLDWITLIMHFKPCDESHFQLAIGSMMRCACMQRRRGCGLVGICYIRC